MLPRQDQRRHTPACNDNGLFSCKRCSVGVFASGDFGTGLFYGISIPTLDDIDIDELLAAPLKLEDGLHDRFDRVPEDTRML